MGKQKPLGDPEFTCSEFSAVCTRLGTPCTNCPRRVDKIYVEVCPGNHVIFSNFKCFVYKNDPYNLHTIFVNFNLVKASKE